MTQQIINLGVGPDTQTGDSLFTAFNKVNDNFGELYTVFGSNSITTINANVVLANSITVSSNVRSGNLFAYGNLETIGYVIAAGVFYPNGVPIGGSGQIDSNLIPITSNIYSVGNVSNQFTEGYFSSNITLSGANVTVRNSQLLVNGQFVSGNYGNSNVAQYLPVYGGNIAATITTASQPYITSVGTLTGLNVVGNTSISGNLDVSGTITYLNVRDFSVQDPIVTLNTGPNGSPLVSNNSFDSGVRTYYYDGQNKASFFGRTNSTGYFEYFSNVISETGNIITGTYGTIKTANLILTAAANIAGNVTGNYFLGNGRFLTGIDATSIQNGNSNVKVYENGNVSVTTAGANTWNFDTAGQLTVPGAILTASASKLDLVGFGPNTAYLTTTADDSTALFMGAAVVDLRALDSISITTNTDDTSYLWTFAADGNLTLPGNLNVAGFTVINSNGNVVTSSLENSGVTAGTYGNASSVPSITVDSKGRVTAVSNVAVAGVSNVSYNTTTGNLTVSTSSGTNYVVDLGVGTADSPIFSGLSVSGNTAVNALTINNSATIGSTLGVTGNIVGANITVVNGVFATVQSATIGNTGTNYTGSTYTATGSFNGPHNGTLGIAGGNAAIVSTLSATGAATVDSLQVNNAATVGSALTVGGLATLNSFYANTDSIVGANLTVVGNLVVSGNVITTGSNNTYFTDSVIELHTLPNLANLTFNDGKDIGIRFHFYKTQNDNAFLGWQNETGYLEWIGSGATEDINANIITGSFGTIKSGELILANATPSTSLGTGALQVNGGASFGGNVYANGVAYFGNATAIALTHPLIVATTTANTYTQIQIQNQSTGGAASSDFIATADDGTDTTRYIDMGINGSGWNQSTWTVSGPRDGYLYTSGVNLTIGTDTVGKTLKIHTGGLLAACVVATFNDAGTVSSTSSTGALVLTGGLGVSGAINGGSTLGLVGNATVSALTVNNSATIGTTLGVTGNINGNSITLTGSLTARGPGDFDGGLQSTPIGNASASTGQFTTVSATGNITGAALTANGSVTAGTTLSALGGLQATPIGNVTPSSAQFTTVNTSGNLTTSALTINNSASIGTTLGVTGNINGNGITLTGSLTARGPGDFDGGLQSTPIGNASASTGQFTTVSATGNITGAALTANGSITAGTTLSAAGGIQNTPIGNASASTGQFTTVSATGNITGAALTVNGSATIGTTLSVTSNITLGTGSGGNITGANIISANSFVATVSFNGPLNGTLGSAGGNTAIVSTLSATGNATVNALTVNNSSTIGGTLGVTGNTIVGNLSTAGNISAVYFFGNGSQLTGIDATSIQNGTSNVRVYLNGPITISSAGTANVLTITDTAVTSTRTIIGTTVQAAQLGNTGSLLTGTLTTTAQPNIASVSNTLTIGQITIGSNSITSTNDTITIEPAGPGATGNVVIEGNLRVTGNVIAVDSQVIIINDKDILLANNQSTSLGVDGAGIWAGNISGTPIVTFVYNNATTSWQSNVGLTPAANASLSLGGTSNYWGTGYFNSIQTPSITTGTIQGATFTATNSFNGPLHGTLGSAGGNSAIVSTLSATSNATVNALTVNASATIGTTLGVTGNVTAGNITTAGLIRATATTAATSNVTGAVQVSGGVGVAGNIYVGQRVGWVAANSVSVVYQVYNAATNSLDTVFG